MKKLILTIAVLALVAMPIGAQADGKKVDDIKISQDLKVKYDFKTHQDVKVKISKDLDVKIKADVHVTDEDVAGVAAATIKNDQLLKWNYVDNIENVNAANIGDYVLQNAKGNIGANVVAGDNNAQDNLAALAAAETEGSMTDAEIFKTQLSLENFTYNNGNTNSASISGYALQNAEGNIGVNVTSGNNNAQSNMLAISVAPAKVGMASVTLNQEAAGNVTINEPVMVDKVIYLPVDLTLEAGFYGGYYGYYAAGEPVEFGGTWGSYEGTEGGSYIGKSDQIGDVYLDIWEGEEHPTGPNIGHVDVDRDAQNAQDLNDDGGAFAFNENGTYKGKESGTYSGSELGIEGGGLDGEILGSVYGSVPVVYHRVKAVTNTASLSGNALQNARGNIGVNVAAGTGNLQANALAISYLPVTPESGGVE